MTDVNPLDALAGLQFSKGHGTGNDFVLVTDPEASIELTPEAVAALCDRHLGIGADGLIRAVRSASLPEGQALLAENAAAEWFMDYRNGDGSVSEMCGNGVRVFVHFLRLQGLVSLDDGDMVTIGTRAGLKTVRRTVDGYAVGMGQWSFIDETQARSTGTDALVRTSGLDVTRPAVSISMGNPHTVVALADDAELTELNLFVAPTVEPLPQHGTNVEFAHPADPLVHNGYGVISMRVHERGVGETMSCGTGACAAAAATRFWAGAGAPDQWRVRVPGGVVGVTFGVNAAGGEDVELSGPAVIVSSGTLGSTL